MNHYTDLFKHLGSGVTVLTPNRRLSATLQRDYQAHQVSQDQKSWETADILPLFSFMQRLWQDYTIETPNPASLPLLLTREQEHLLWEQCLTHYDDSLSLLQRAKTVDSFQSAWQLLHEWCIDLDHPDFETADTYRVMQRIAKQMQRVLFKNNWQSLSCLPQLLISLIKNGEIPLPKQLYFIGFTEISPMTQLFIQACEEQGTLVYCHHHPHIQGDDNNKKLSLPDCQTEILTMARWAKATLAQHPHARIGCVVPQLTAQREQVASLFSAVFADDCASFNISSGQYLSQYPIIHTALTLLSLHQTTISREIFCYLLTSPYLGEAEIEYVKRANVDKHLRQHNVSEVSLRNLLNDQAFPISLAIYAPLLAKRLAPFFSMLDQLPSSQSHYQWAKLFSELLGLLGWPGERSLLSEEYQITAAWLKLLNQLAKLDLVTDNITYQHALAILKKNANSTLFQAKTPTAPIQILGTLEAAGIPFDFLWVNGMTDRAWPPQPDPHPFIPKKLQHELNMPHATAERELHFCKQLIQQYQYHAHQLIFSFAEKEEEIEIQPTSLLNKVTAIKATQLILSDYTAPAAYLFATRKIEMISDAMAPPIAIGEEIKGGVRVIQDQASCPFKSYILWRIGAKPLETPIYGLRKQDRGRWVHRTFEKIWGELRTQEALLNLDSESLSRLIHTTIELALQDFPHAYQDFKQYLLLEKKRLYQIISAWLVSEKNRPTFTVIAQEKKIAISLSSLTLSTRIDRIDEIDHQQHLIIDYKTSPYHTINHWFSTRPEEPQLPLYLLAEEAKTVGLAYATIAARESGWHGVSRHDTAIKGIRPLAKIDRLNTTWEAQLIAWKAILHQLAEDFANGIATVDPKDLKQTCLRCELKSLCRINEEITHDSSSI